MMPVFAWIWQSKPNKEIEIAIVSMLSSERRFFDQIDVKCISGLVNSYLNQD